MNRTAAAFLTITAVTALLAALSFVIRMKGYPSGSLGIERLEAIASAGTFIPIAALYAFPAALMMIMPARVAGFIYANAASPIWSGVLVLLASILGLQVARLAFGSAGALWPLLDWRFLFAAGVLGGHLLLDALRRNVLLRTLAFVSFTSAMLACLYWTFRL